MRVAVMGAGLSGLAAARELVDRGHEVVVIEKSRGVGGRLAARRVDGVVLDHGSRVTAAPAGTALRALLDQLDAPDRVELADGVAFPAGATRLPKLIAEGLDVRLGVRLAALRPARTGLELGDEQGNTHGVVDAAVVTGPAPQVADILERSPEGGARVAALREVTYRPAVMILLGVRGSVDLAEVVRPADGPIGAVRREDLKGRAAGEVVPIVVRLREGASADLLDAPDDDVIAQALPALAGLLGYPVVAPAWAQVKRWRYAVPVGRADREAVNPAGARIVVAGDALTGAGFGATDHHRVYDSGIDAARRACAWPA